MGVYRFATKAGSEVTHGLDRSLERAEVIVANRLTDDIAPVLDRVFTRDLFGSD